jgi:predicted HicB family RNase H-like nuclease
VNKLKAFNFQVTEGLWREVKIAAIRQGLPVRQWIINAIEKALKA